MAISSITAFPTFGGRRNQLGEALDRRDNPFLLGEFGYNPLTGVFDDAGNYDKWLGDARFLVDTEGLGKSFGERNYYENSINDIARGYQTERLKNPGLSRSDYIGSLDLNSAYRLADPREAGRQNFFMRTRLT
jgi:hypothetical protein